MTEEVQVTIAELLAKGLVEQLDAGIRPTRKGRERASDVWESITSPDKLLLIPFLREYLHLEYKEEK